MLSLSKRTYLNFRKHTYKYIQLFIFACFFVSINAQESNFVKYSISSGLPQSEVNEILFDSRGMLWAATSGGGVACFNGVSFSTFDESKGLAGNIVLDIEEDAKGRIFCVSSWGGISIIENNRISKIIEFSEDFPGVNSIEKDSYGRIWVAGANLGYIENDQLILVTSDLALPFVTKPNLRSVGDELLITANNKLIVLDVVNKVQKYAKTYPYNLHVAFKHNDLTYLGTEKQGLFIDSNGVVSKIELPYGEYKKEIRITDFLVENNAKIWVTSKNGAYSIENATVDFFAEEKGGGAYELTSACFDAQGNIWFGSSGEGVVGIVNTPFSFFKNVKGLNKSDNFGVLEDHLGRVWVANNEEGIFIYDGYKVEHISQSNGLAGNSTRVLAQDSQNNVWVGTRSGLSIVSPDLSVKNQFEFKGMFVKSLLVSEDILYVGTVSNGVWEISEGKAKRIFENEIGNAYSLCLDANQDLVVGTNVGCYLKVDGVYQLTKKDLKNTYVGNVTLDRNGFIWVGTDRSISRWDGDHFVNYDINNGLTSDLVYVLFSDEKGFLWCGTNKGLDRISLDSKSEIAKIKHYGYEEGFKGVELNSKGFFENQNGEIYFSTVKGIHKYIPEYDFNYSYNTPVYISSIKLFLERIDDNKLVGGVKNWFGIPKNITFETNENHISFDFFAIDFLNPSGINYTYFLEGFDKQWSPPTTSRNAIYSNLAPGLYTFKVKQYGNDFSQIATINFRIKKPSPSFFSTIWFLLLCLIIFIIVIYYFTEYRTTKLRNQQAYLESKIEERTQEIKESEKEKTVLLQEVHHRVKNNLQIIISLFRLQSHFTDNEEALELFKSSQNRIRSMSKIHEKLYETEDLSKVEMKTYIEELVDDLVTSYDVNNSVSVERHIQNCSINLNELTPFALVLNEVITNSLKYGFENVEDPCIRISLKQTVLGDTTVVISDNGPGFDNEIWENHKTMGMELIKTLTEQLDGSIILDQSSGHPVFTLKFKAS